MKYFKRKDGFIFGKTNPTKDQLEQYKKDGVEAVKDATGKVIKKVKKKINRIL